MLNFLKFRLFPLLSSFWITTFYFKLKFSNFYKFSRRKMSLGHYLYLTFKNYSMFLIPIRLSYIFLLKKKQKKQKKTNKQTNKTNKITVSHTIVIDFFRKITSPIWIPMPLHESYKKKNQEFQFQTIYFIHINH